MVKSNFNDPFTRWNLRHAINASGTKTSIGASSVLPEVIEAVTAILPEFVSIDELQSRASAVIAASTGADAGCITDCSAAGLCQSIAAALTGSNLAAIEKLPDCGDRERRVAIPMGHMINYGSPVPQIISVTGATVVPIGTAAQCETYHLRHELERGCAAAVYVVSHHTVREGELPMDLFIDICKQYDTPVIVDMASEYDLRSPVTLGADAVVYSGHKFLSGITSGVVAGTEDFIRSVYLQSRGIGRIMKVGKESIVGAMAALELWAERDANIAKAKEEQIILDWEQALQRIQGVRIDRHEDWTGNPITRLRLTISPEACGLHAWELAERLAARDPAIIVRDDLAEHQEIYLDPCTTESRDATLVSAAIIEEISTAKASGNGCKKTWSDTKLEHEYSPLSWPTAPGG